jgi:hypothetical protein
LSSNAHLTSQHGSSTSEETNDLPEDVVSCCGPN